MFYIPKKSTGKNQKDKLLAKGREQQYGMLLETLEHPDLVLEEKDKEPNMFHERQSSLLFVKTFQKQDGTKYVHFESVTIQREGMEVSISSHIIRENQLRNKLKSDRLLYKATALNEPAHPSAEQPTNEGVSLSSIGKDNSSSSKNQGNQQENGGAEPNLFKNGEPDTQDEETETNGNEVSEAPKTPKSKRSPKEPTKKKVVEKGKEIRFIFLKKSTGKNQRDIYTIWVCLVKSY